MNATDELRRLLDERGVEWWPMHDVENGYHQDRDTEFLVYGCKHVAHEWGGRLQVDMLTPEQAIAATLGGQPARLTAEQVRGVLLLHLPHREYYSIAQTDGWQAIADELNVMLGNDDDYEAKMDALLCRLTNGKWSKSRAYDLDFMVSCVNEEYEKAYAEELAATTQGATEIVRCRDCKHYHKHKWFDIIPGTPLGSDMSDVCMFFGGGVKVEPGGFCKWDERREQ